MILLSLFSEVKSNTALYSKLLTSDVVEIELIFLQYRI